MVATKHANPAGNVRGPLRAGEIGRLTEAVATPTLRARSDRCNTTNMHQDHRAASPLKQTLAVGVGVLVIYALFSWDFLVKPSPHFHFLDQAAGFLDGKLQTDTPRRWKGQRPRDDDRPGLQEAVDRHLAVGGWNDWASYRVLVLAGGEEVRGVFPYKNNKGPRRNEFWTVDGKMMVIDVTRDLATGCDPERPAAKCDRVEYKISFPPGPGLLLMPFVAVFGYNVNDVWFTLLFAAASPVLLLLWLRRLRAGGFIHHRNGELIWLVAMFALGTVALYCGIRGSVWFTALTLGVTMHFGYLLAAQGARRPVLAGAILGFGVATRTPLLFASVFFLFEALYEDGLWLGGDGMNGFKRALRKLLLFAAPMAAVGIALAWYNWARWQNPLEFGHFYLLEGTRAPTRDHGLFNFFFLNHNLSAALTNVPRISDQAPFVQVTRHGLGILACTPALLALIGGREPHDSDPVEPDMVRKRRVLGRNLAIGIFAVAFPALLYQNDGWQQFGYRFSLDFWPLLMGLFALRIGNVSRGVKVLIVIGIVVQAFGAVTFGRFEHFYYG